MYWLGQRNSNSGSARLAYELLKADSNVVLVVEDPDDAVVLCNEVDEDILKDCAEVRDKLGKMVESWIVGVYTGLIRQVQAIQLTDQNVIDFDHAGKKDLEELVARQAKSHEEGTSRLRLYDMESVRRIIRSIYPQRRDAEIKINETARLLAASAQHKATTKSRVPSYLNLTSASSGRSKTGISTRPSLTSLFDSHQSDLDLARSGSQRSLLTPTLRHTGSTLSLHRIAQEPEEEAEDENQDQPATGLLSSLRNIVTPTPGPSMPSDPSPSIGRSSSGRVQKSASRTSLATPAKISNIAETPEYVAWVATLTAAQTLSMFETPTAWSSKKTADFKTQISPFCTDRNKFINVMRDLDKAAFGLRTADPPFPHNCLFASLNHMKASIKGSSVLRDDCPAHGSRPLSGMCLHLQIKENVQSPFVSHGLTLETFDITRQTYGGIRWVVGERL